MTRCFCDIHVYLICLLAEDSNRRKNKRKEKRKKRKRVTNKTSDSSSESSGEPCLEKSATLTCDARFKFYKVGKASPSLGFTTIIRLNKGISLSDLRKDLIQQHMIGIELFKKLPAYDVHIHVTKKDKTYTAHTVQQWSEVQDFLTQGYSLLGMMAGMLLSAVMF